MNRGNPEEKIISPKKSSDFDKDLPNQYVEKNNDSKVNKNNSPDYKNLYIQENKQKDSKNIGNSIEGFKNLKEDAIYPLIPVLEQKNQSFPHKIEKEFGKLIAVENFTQNRKNEFEEVNNTIQAKNNMRNLQSTNKLENEFRTFPTEIKGNIQNLASNVKKDLNSKESPQIILEDKSNKVLLPDKKLEIKNPEKPNKIEKTIPYESRIENPIIDSKLFHYEENKKEFLDDSLLSYYEICVNLPNVNTLGNILDNKRKDSYIQGRDNIAKRSLPIIDPIKENPLRINKERIEALKNRYKSMDPNETAATAIFTLYFQKSQSITIPEEQEFPYSCVEEFNLKNCDFKFLSREKKSQVLLGSVIENEQKKEKFIIKRTCYFFEQKFIALKTKFIPSNDEYQTILKFYSILCNKLSEFDNYYYIHYLIPERKVVPQLYDYKIIYLPNFNCIVLEEWQEYCGEILNANNEFNSRNPEFADKLTDKIIKLIYFILKFRVMQNDLKSDNITLKKSLNGDFSLILIDFDISNPLSLHFKIDALNVLSKIMNDKRKDTLFDLNNLFKINYTIDIKQINGYTPEYVAPEILNNFEKAQKDKSFKCPIRIDACQAYSLGVILLEAIGFLDEFYKNHKSLDDYKSSQEKYREFENLIYQFRISKNNPIINKIITFASYCISYDPEERLDILLFSESLKDSFESITELDIINFYQFQINIKKSLQDQYLINLKRFEEWFLFFKNIDTFTYVSGSHLLNQIQCLRDSVINNSFLDFSDDFFKWNDLANKFIRDHPEASRILSKLSEESFKYWKTSVGIANDENNYVWRNFMVNNIKHISLSNKPLEEFIYFKYRLGSKTCLDFDKKVQVSMNKFDIKNILNYPNNQGLYIYKLFPESLITKHLKNNDKLVSSLFGNINEREINKRIRIFLNNKLNIEDEIFEENYTDFGDNLNKIVMKYLFNRFSKEFFFISYEQNDLEDCPYFKDSTFSNFKNIFPENTQYEIKFRSEDTQIINCIVNDEPKYVVKRICISFLPCAKDMKKKSESKENEQNLDKEFEENLGVIEKNIMSLYFSEFIKQNYNFQFVTSVKEFRFIFLTKQNYLILESVNDYIGKPCSEYHNFKFGHPTFANNFVSALLDMQFQLESSFLNFEIFNPKEIFIFDQINNKNLIHYYIDSFTLFNNFYKKYFQNLESLKPQLNTNNTIRDNDNGTQLDSIYIAPELLFNYDYRNTSRFQKQEIDISKCQVYSIGIIILEAIGFFKEVDGTIFSELKADIEEYKQIYSLIYNFGLEKMETTISKALIIALLTLKYEINERLSATEIYMFVKSFDIVTPEELDEGIRRLIDYRNFNHDSLEEIKLDLLFVRNQKSLDFLQDWFENPQLNSQCDEG